MRRRISWLVVATTSTVVACFVIPLCLLVRTLAEDRAMAAADQEARSVAMLVVGVEDASGLAELVGDLDARGVPATGVLTAGGETVGSMTPAVAADPEVGRSLRNQEAFSVVDERGGRVLLPVVREDGTAVVRSFVTPADLRRGVSTAWFGISGLGLLLLALAVGVASRLAQRVSEPVREVAATAHALRQGDLSARAPTQGPKETEELARALNGLAERILELLAAERVAVADLSHRLRTPVTALRLDAEAIADAALAARMQDHITSLQRSVDAIVKQARRPVRADLAGSCDAGAVVRDRVAFWSPLAEDQGRPLRVDLAAERVLVPLAAEDLTDLVDVLVDNVFAHTPERTGFEVRLQADRAEARLVVVDHGSGIDGSPGGDRPGSTGLGLDIARRTARDAGGRLHLASDPGAGTTVVVGLPRVAD